MNAETITCLNFIVHSLVIGAAAWLLVRFIIRDALRRCILANLAVLMCVYSPFNISMQDLFPVKKAVPVWTPIQETFKADWRVSVSPASVLTTSAAVERRGWDVNEVMRGMRWLAWIGTAALLMRLLVQSIGVQRWAWGLRRLTCEEMEFLHGRVLECDSLPTLSSASGPSESSRGLEHCFASLTLRATFGWLSPLRYGSRTLPRVRVFDGASTPCAAGWFFPVIAVPVSAFGKLTPRQWRWLLRHEAEHLRMHDTVVVVLQNMVRAFLWWNPFAHALIEEYARAREEACDAAAVGAEREHTDYADFLLAWAERSAPQHECVMAIAYSRPAKRLKVRLVALMEARGVRKKLGALFVLGCLAFAVVAPLIAASFGIATAVAQEPVKVAPRDTKMFTRIYRVGTEFREAGNTAQSLIEKQGIPFPEGASALYNPANSQLIVRHYKGALDQVEAIVDRLNKRYPLVYFHFKLIQADSWFGTHGGILKSDEAKDLWARLSQQKDVHLLRLPSVTGKLGLGITNEAVREVFPEKLPEGKAPIEFKFIGPSIEVIANPASDGKALIEAKVKLGVDPDGDYPWLSKGGAKPAWDRVQFHTAAAKGALASGETLVMHLVSSKKPVTVLITAEALNPNGRNAVSFESTATTLPSSTGINVPDKAANEWNQRVYRVPPNFPKDKAPMEVLRAAGISFEKNASAVFKDGKLIVRNTKANLELIEVWIASLIDVTKNKSVRVTVQAVEMKGDILKLLNEWVPPLPVDPKIAETLDPALTEPQPQSEFMRQIFSTAGIFSPSQVETVIKRIRDSKAKIEILKTKGELQIYKLPVAMGDLVLKVESPIGGDRNTIDLTTVLEGANERSSSGVCIWGGQTVVLARQHSEDAGWLLFITANIEDAKGKK
jgi:hypothetical protein